ncbi:DUF3857 domain-containing transglutaminase family protein [Aquimarina mytili]|uniref:DUF3857 domain-containing transglutaminase family protein n=1 Tax=Aquimarina mytili TaxID=874423 RepID=A0A936ZRQ0_9FLAO|nr:DUF3857 domain-containing transglutaminase family protein [Aquimarina mytili]MBL0683478.1 DUF3857 domain-containing transglutaminase family protein [Aquimarina mytili]
MQNKTLRYFVVVTLLIFFKVATAQEKPELQISRIDSALTQNANAVVRSEEVIVEINSINSVTTKTKRIVTVLNKDGKGYADSYEPYSSSVKIKKIEATVYDAKGNEIKKYKKKDFNDISAYDEFSLMNDNRVKYFEYTPLGYPYTLVYESEVETTSTAFIEPWIPILTYRLSVEKSSFKILNPTSISIRLKETNFDGFSIESNKIGQEVSYSISNVSAKVKEAYSPSFYDLVPVAKVALDEFSLEGVEGAATDWKSFGKWQFDELLSGRDELPEETIKKVSELVATAKTNKEKAKLIYQYVQDKTRYVSVQLGIGGWMPFLASDVDRLGYGDCKALTNYTKALLDSQDIPSYYAVVYGDRNKRDIDSEFASMQGNHVILNIPEEDEDLWLECTSQTMPFNFIGDFTDNRNVLIVTPEGGKIKKTKKYEPEENILKTTANVNLKIDKSMTADIERVSEGLEYSWNSGIQFETTKDQKLEYKEFWGYINALAINEIKLNDDKDVIKFTENIKVSSPSYTKKVGSRLLVTPNLFGCDQSNLPKYENRKTSMVISRGYVNTDEYIINLPKGYTFKSLPQKKSIETEFGQYMYELEEITESQIKFKRFLKIIDGTFPKEKYEEYRKFRSDIKKIDQTKIVLNQL